MATVLETSHGRFPHPLVSAHKEPRVEEEPGSGSESLVLPSLLNQAL